MSQAGRNIWLTLILLLSFQSLFGQDVNLLQRTVSLKFNETTLLGHVDNLFVQEKVIVAFNSSRVDLQEVIALPSGDLPLREVVSLLFYSHNISISASNNKVIVAFLDRPISEQVTIKGYIRDSETGEALIGASLHEALTNTSTFSNESGFYSLTIPRGANNVNIQYLGYDTQVLQDISHSSQDINLVFNEEEIEQVIINGTISDNFLPGTGSEKIDLSLTRGFQSSSGDNDPIRNVRINPEVQSGNEGQVGLYVRGGGSDQNLILLDGIPLYEVSHTAGFSSIFIEESIKDIDFISNGFPARYGGRLSSVMNVHLKEGNLKGYNGSLKLSLPAMKAHLEGPIFGDSTTFNISGRISYVDKYLNQLIGGIVNFDNIDLNYNDFIGKITHRFTNTQSLSFSYYTGEDNIGLLRNTETTDEENNIFSTSSNNGVRWGSTVWNGRYSNIIGDKFLMTFNVGGIQYQNDSRAVFSIKSIQDNLQSKQELDVITHTQINDQLVGLNFDYYHSDHHRFKFGASWIHHQYSPALYGSDTISTEQSTQIIPDSIIFKADEVSFYVEDTYRPNDHWQFYGGLHFSGYNTGSRNYSNVQPRFSTVYTPDSWNRFTLSFSNMYQYVHLLVNPGTGLPSDFWVPSTDDLDPEFARQISVDYSRRFGKSFELSLSAYTKQVDNVLEYENTIDLFFDFVNSTHHPTVLTDPDWQNYVKSGSSSSRGLEFQARKTAGVLTGWASYAWAKTSRLFEGINNGEEFPYKYDRRHDINLGLKYQLNHSFSVALNWAYGSGNAFSVANERVLTPFVDENGNPIEVITNSGERNNFRFPAYSHLDVQFNYHKVVGSGKLTFNLGLYNVYNRKNAYYIYIYNNPTRSNNVAYKTSLFPILPNMSIGYSF